MWNWGGIETLDSWMTLLSSLGTHKASVVMVMMIVFLVYKGLLQTLGCKSCGIEVAYVLSLCIDQGYAASVLHWHSQVNSYPWSSFLLWWLVSRLHLVIQHKSWTFERLKEFHIWWDFWVFKPLDGWLISWPLSGHMATDEHQYLMTICDGHVPLWFLPYSLRHLNAAFGDSILKLCIDSTKWIP